MVNRDQVSRFHHQESLPGAERESGIRISSQIDKCAHDGQRNRIGGADLNSRNKYSAVEVHASLCRARIRKVGL